MEKLKARWEGWKARRICKRSGHAWVYVDRIRLVRLTDDPWLDFIDGLPAGKAVKCLMCDVEGVETKDGTVVAERVGR